MNALADVTAQTDRSLHIVEDDKPFLERLSRAMETRGFAVTSCDTVTDGLAHIGKSAPAFAVVDLRLGDGNGLDVVSALKQQRPDARAIVLTGSGRNFSYGLDVPAMGGAIASVLNDGGSARPRAEFHAEVLRLQRAISAVQTSRSCAV